VTTGLDSWVALAPWRDQLDRSSSHLPWPGPRPLDAGERLSLVGRDAELGWLLATLRERRLIHLRGPSGVGKTSLLMAGIVPALEDAGYIVAICRSWGLRASEQSFADYLGHTLHQSLPETWRSRTSADANLFWELAELGGMGVVILDQFEEFLRKPGEWLEDAFDFLIDLHRQTSVRVVLSYRSEYESALKRLDRDPRIRHSATLEVLPLPNQAGRELIDRPSPPSGVGADWQSTDLLEAAAAAQIYDIWTAGRHSKGDGAGLIGMLHLQALLSVLHMSSRGRITTADVGNYRRRAEEQGQMSPRELVEFSLEESTTLRLDQARDAARAVGMDEYAIRGAEEVLAKVVPHLSSGGFKVEQDIASLAEKVFPDELRQVRSDVQDRVEPDSLGTVLIKADDTDTAMEQLLVALVATLTKGLFSDDQEETYIECSRAAICAAADSLQLGDEREALEWGAETWRSLLSIQDDRYGSAGPMLGLSPLCVLIEQLRRFAWALVWLESLNIARIGGRNDGRTTVVLVHDGFGSALESWSDHHMSNNATTAIYALSTSPGEVHEWGDPDHPNSERCLRYRDDLNGEPDNPRLHINLGFRGNAIMFAALRHCVFVNCEFSGTVFSGCSFEGVTFLNCRLDGAVFDSCSVVGSANNTPRLSGILDEGDPMDILSLARPQEYAIPNTKRLGTILGRYREQPLTDAQVVIAGAPGLPATPGFPGHQTRLWESAASDGLIIHGSRLATIIFRNTVFAGGRIVFRRVRGSGLEMARLGDFSGVDFVHCLLRHATFTQAETAPGELDIRMEQSVAAQWWVGAGFGGSMRVKRCHLGQLWVESPDLDLDVDDECQSVDIAAAARIGGHRLAVNDAADALEPGEPGAVALFSAAAAAMDYRTSAETLSSAD